MYRCELEFETIYPQEVPLKERVTRFTVAKAEIYTKIFEVARRDLLAVSLICRKMRK